MERIGIYGGTFNPPHIGHMQAAKQAVTQLQLDRLLLIPDRIAPHKQLPEGSASPEQRLRMLEISAEEMEKIQVSDIELRRNGISYTYLTILQLREQYPDAELFLIMGTDMFLSFQNWKETEIITKNASLAVLYRGEKDEIAAIEAKKVELDRLGVRIVLLRNEVTAISSTQLRCMLIFGCGDAFLPEGVGAYIRRYGLYGVSAPYRNLSEERLRQVVISLAKPSRVAHILGCRDTAVALAKAYCSDVTDAARAGLLHDITKPLNGSQHLTLCKLYGILLDDFSSRYPNTIHALTGSLVADKIFGEKDTVVSAIGSHTTGKPNMSLLEKILYVADQIEPTRSFPGVEKLRTLAFSDIDAALAAGMEMTLTHLRRQGEKAAPETEAALRWLRRNS